MLCNRCSHGVVLCGCSGARVNLKDHKHKLFANSWHFRSLQFFGSLVSSLQFVQTFCLCKLYIPICGM